MDDATTLSKQTIKFDTGKVNIALPNGWDLAIRDKTPPYPLQSKHMILKLLRYQAKKQ